MDKSRSFRFPKLLRKSYLRQVVYHISEIALTKQHYALQICNLTRKKYE